MKRIIKGVLVLVAGLIAAVAAVFLVSSVLYTPTYMARYVWYNTSELTDWKIFPCNKVENRAPAFLFRKVAGQDRVRSLAGGVAYESHRSGMTEIGDLDAFLAGNATTAFIVIKDDAVLYEKYFNGYKRDTMLNCFSVSKSFTSALVGIALDEGLIKDIDDPITAYLPELKDKGHRDITIRHLLMMSSGMSYSAGDLWWQDDPINYYYADLRKLAIQRARIEEPPGRHHLYNNYHPQLLGMILERVTGGTVSHYIQEKIWKPLGMEFPAVWSLDSEEHRFEHMIDRVEDPVEAEHLTLLPAVERQIVVVRDPGAGDGILVEQPLYRLAVQHGPLEDLGHVLGSHARAEHLLGKRHDDRSLLTEPVTAGGLHRHLAVQAAPVDLPLEGLPGPLGPKAPQPVPPQTVTTFASGSSREASSHCQR